MSGVGMDVLADLSINGTSTAIASLNQVAAAADRSAHAIDKIGEASTHALGTLGAFAQGAAGHIASFTLKTAAALTALGAHQGLSLVSDGVAGINNELEKTRLSFATTFRMFGAAGSIQQGLDMSVGLMAQLRADAASLPGEFQDFASMAQTLTNPILQAGLGVKEIRDLTRQTVVAAANAGVNFGVAAHEMSAALGGRVSAAMPLMRYLGVHHDTKIKGASGADVEFSKATYAERFAFLSNKLKSADEALPLFARSWEGMTSSMRDNWTSVKGALTEPLFERMKSTLWDLSGAWDKHKAHILDVAQSYGITLGNAWLVVEHKLFTLPQKLAVVRDHWVDIRGQILGTVHAIETLWHRVEPMMEKIGKFAMHEMEHPTQAFRHLLMLKAAGMGMSGASSILQTASTMKVLAGGGTAAGGGAASALGSAAAGTAGAAGAVTLAITLASMVAVMDDVNNSATKVRLAVDDVTVGLDSFWSSLTGPGTIARDVMGGIGSIFVDLGSGVATGFRAELDAITFAFERANSVYQRVKDKLDRQAEAGGATSTAMGLVSEGLGILKDNFIGLLNPMAGVYLLMKRFGNWTGLTEESKFQGVDSEPIDKSTTVSALANMAPSALPKAGGFWDKPKVQPPAHVDARGSKIEIKLDARGETPDRIARKLFDAVGHVLARPLTSPYGPQKGY